MTVAMPVHVQTVYLTDQDIGYGPSIDTPTLVKEDIHDHPLAPPVTSPDGFMDESADVSKFSSNIIMSRKSDQVREVCYRIVSS